VTAASFTAFCEEHDALIRAASLPARKGRIAQLDAELLPRAPGNDREPDLPSRRPDGVLSGVQRLVNVG